MPWVLPLQTEGRWEVGADGTGLCAGCSLGETGWRLDRWQALPHFLWGRPTLPAPPAPPGPAHTPEAWVKTLSRWPQPSRPLLSPDPPQP